MPICRRKTLALLRYLLYQVSAIEVTARFEKSRLGSLMVTSRMRPSEPWSDSV